MYANVRYSIAIVNRTQEINMNPVDSAVQKELNTNDGVKSKKAKKRSKPKKKTKRSAVKKTAKRKSAKPKKKVGRKSGIARSERLDMRLSKAEKAKIVAKAKKTRRTVTSLVYEAIEKIR